MNSLELIPLRKEVLNWQRIEKFISYPKIFKIFNDLFVINQLLDCDKAHFIDEKTKIKKTLGMFKSEIKDSIVVYNFYNPDEIIETVELLMDKDDIIDRDILDKGYIPFAYCASEQLLLISTKGDNVEGIFLLSRWNSSPLELLAPNIFAFFQQFYLHIEEKDMIRFLDGGLYKNWSEGFWRIRSEDQSA